MATLTAQAVVDTGLEATYSAAAAGGDQFSNTGIQFVHVKNGAGGDITLTVTAQNTQTPSISGYGVGTKSNSVTTVTAGEERFIGPFPKQAFNDTSGNAQITYSSTASVTLAIIQFQKAP
jgi:hypothetical protein